MIKSFASNQFLVFLITGGIAALVNFGSRVIYNVFVDFSYAIILAYLTGMSTAFFLAKRYVFTQSSQKLNTSIMFFSLVNLVAVVQTWLISMCLAYYLLPSFGVVDYVLEISHAVGISIPVFTSYLGHKYFSFK
jgi:putative flippase GtrA